VNAVNITAGSDNAIFAFKSSTVGKLHISAVAQGLADGAGLVEIARGSGNELAFLTPPQTLIAGACSTPVTIQFQKADGSPVQFSSDTQVNLSNDAPSGFTLFGGSGCSGNPITSLTIVAGQNSTTFSFKMTLARPVTLTASAAGMVSGIQVESVNAGAPSQLVLTTPAQVLVAGNCSSILTVETRDAFGNPAKVVADATSSLSALPSTSAYFYSDQGCLAGIGNTIIKTNTSSASFYFKGGTAGSVALSVTSPNLSTATQTETVRPGTAAQIVFTSASQTVRQGWRSGPVTFGFKDVYGNVGAALASPATVGISVISSDSYSNDYYCQSTCTLCSNDSSADCASLSLIVGQSSGEFYFNSSENGTTQIRIRTSLPNVGASSATQSETVTY
jgi:hypothetical protein